KKQSFIEWLDRRITAYVEPLVTLMRAAKDVRIVREALETGFYDILARHNWQHAEQYRLALSIGRELALPYGDREFWHVCELVDMFTDASEARELLAPFFKLILQIDAERRDHFLCRLDNVLPGTRSRLRRVLPRLARYMPRITAFVHR